MNPQHTEPSGEIIEGNRLIAEFMGTKLGVDLYSWRPGCTEPIREEHLNYHASWGWIMPVVEAIEYKYGKLIRIEGYVCEATASANENPRHVPFNIKRHTNSKIDSVWQVVIAFIKWYNQTQSIQ